MYNLTALCTILLYCGQSYRTGALKGGGMGPETSLVHKITYGPMIYTAPYVLCLIGANPLQGPLEGLGHESQDFFGP